MLRVAVQVKELISSNVTSVVESASNPAKMLNRLQREIEEAIIALEGERTLAKQRHKRLQTKLTEQEMREADWADKAKTAMDHGREDLARQALMAREDCRLAIVDIKDDITTAENDMEEVEAALTELEAKREDTRQKAKDQVAADAANAPKGTPGTASSKADRHLGRISEMQKRTEFATEDHAVKREHASVDEEIDAMRRASLIDAEIEAMKGPAKKAAPKPRAKKTTSKKL